MASLLYPRVPFAMYVCVCRAVSDSKIRQAMEQGACTVRALKDQLGVGSVCGRCVPEARHLLAQHRNSQPLRLDQLDSLTAAA
ncbi:MAG TPA: bacterioferritin-associated ferredoxin [Nevskia sp.]|jgi:bacterioferritin-associated ferredoxin|nr:bacterioferritin-associated ferredoxin [Nevskia sp.]